MQDCLLPQMELNTCLFDEPMIEWVGLKEKIKEGGYYSTPFNVKTASSSLSDDLNLSHCFGDLAIPAPLHVPVAYE